MIKTAQSSNKGFTLVELLIVIALLGVLAVTVLAAINPLEQLNRARDTGMESDASQLLAAIDRYYATQQRFPWVAVDQGAYTNDTAIPFSSASNNIFGLCAEGATHCGPSGTNGVLIDNFELKTEFKNRGFLTTTAAADMLYIGKAAGASSSVYACWIPRSQSKRQQAANNIAGGGSAPVTDTGCTTRTGTDWDALATACVMCIPK